MHAMHIILRNQVTSQVEGILCVERETKTCIILQADIDRLEDLVTIARGQKIPAVWLIVPVAVSDQLAAQGWKPLEGFVVLFK